MTSQEQKPTLVIRPKRALYIFGGVGLLIVILSFIGQYWYLHPDSLPTGSPFLKTFRGDFISEFDFHGQPNISFYFNMLTLDVASFFLFVIAHFKKVLKDEYRFHWTALAWIVLALAIDTLALIHDKIVEYSFDGVKDSGWIKNGWIIVATVAVLIFVVTFFRFWQHLDSKHRMLFLASIVIYFGGALVKVYSLFTFTALEQLLQYTGATLLLYSVLFYMEAQASRFWVSTK